MTISTAQGFSGAGDVYFQPYLPDGTLDKLVDTGNTTKFAIKPNSTLFQQISHKRDSAGQVLESFAAQDPAELSIVLETVNVDNLRYCFMGAKTTYAQSAATITAEAATLRLDGWVQLANEELGPTVVVRVASVVKTEGTDYQVNRRLGMIRALSTGTIVDNAVASIDYSATAFTGTAIRGNALPQIRTVIVLDAINRVDNSGYVLRAWDAILSTSSEFDWMNSGFNTITLTGKLKTPTNRAEPFKVFAR